MLTFTKPFTQQEPLPEDGIDRAVEILRTGRLHRYNVAAGEEAEASLLERDYAAYQGVKYCIATASGGQAIQLGLRVCGVQPGDQVLANAYTLAPVPGAIHNLGAQPVLVSPMTRRRFKNGRIDSLLTPYAEAVRVVAATTKTPLIDLHRSSVKLFNDLGDAGSAHLSPEGDRTHFNKAGAEKMSDLLIAQFPFAVEELLPYLKN